MVKDLLYIETQKQFVKTGPQTGSYIPIIIVHGVTESDMTERLSLSL